MKRISAAVALIISVSISVSACTAEVPLLAGATSASAELTDLEANTADLEFVQGVMPLLQASVEIGEEILAEEDLSPGVRDVAVRSLARPQDEIIQLNQWSNQWESSTEVVLSPGAPAGTQAQQILSRATGAQREVTYLLLLRQLLMESIELAAAVTAEGESLRLRDIADLMVEVKSIRIGQVEEQLAILGVEPVTLY